MNKDRELPKSEGWNEYVDELKSALKEGQMNIHKGIVEEAARIAKGRAGECKGCDGTGLAQYKTPYPDEYTDAPCPTCAKLREIAEWRWLDTEIHVPHHPEKSKTNPTFTVQTLRQLLEDLGEWDIFRLSLFARLWKDRDYPAKRQIVMFEITDILASDTLMAEAVHNYLKEVK